MINDTETKVNRKITYQMKYTSNIFEKIIIENWKLKTHVFSDKSFCQFQCTIRVQSYVSRLYAFLGILGNSMKVIPCWVNL